jgi:hypothetical protein
VGGSVCAGGIPGGAVIAIQGASNPLVNPRRAMSNIGEPPLWTRAYFFLMKSRPRENYVTSV